MRYNQYLTEGIDVLSDAEYAKLKKDCLPYLKDVKKRLNKTNKFLFRGMWNFGADFALKTTRKDRRPLDSSPRWHNDLGNAFKKKFGVNARSEGVFTFGYPFSNFGHPYLIFPTGKYYCLWSTKVVDATEWEPDSIYAYGEDAYGEDITDSVNTYIDGVINTYRKGTVNAALNSVESHAGIRTEIIVICKSYYAIIPQRQPWIERWIENEI